MTCCPPATTLPALLGIAAVAAVLSNVVNNLPAVLVMLPLVAASGPAAVLAVLVGVNVGPNLTYVGSLANLLWRNVVRREMRVGFVEFTRIGLCTVPLTLSGGGARTLAGNQVVRRVVRLPRREQQWDSRRPFGYQRRCGVRATIRSARLVSWL